jgi:hypothetical protein
VVAALSRDRLGGARQDGRAPQAGAGAASRLHHGADLAAEVAAQAPLPDFSANQVGWIAINRDFIAVPGGPRPVSNDLAHPYVLNGIPGAQPTYRVADLNNPNLKPWAKERMKKANDDVLAGKIGYMASPADQALVHGAESVSAIRH